MLIAILFVKGFVHQLVEITYGNLRNETKENLKGDR